MADTSEMNLEMIAFPDGTALVGGLATLSGSTHDSVAARSLGQVHYHPRHLQPSHRRRTHRPQEPPAHCVAKPRRLPNTRRTLLRLHTETACRRSSALGIQLHNLDTDRFGLIQLREKWQHRPLATPPPPALTDHAAARDTVLPTGALLRFRNGHPSPTTATANSGNVSATDSPGSPRPRHLYPLAPPHHVGLG